LKAEREWLAGWAPAKINLWLAVHGRRADGYHELDTVMLSTSLADELRVRTSQEEGIALTVDGPQASADIPADERNLVFRAARAVLDLAVEEGHKVPPGLQIQLTKNVPSQAGLGGGSSDAVTTMRLIEQLLKFDLSQEWSSSFLENLGADCAFFDSASASGLALCSGVGEIVTPIPGAPPAWTIAVLVPDVPCPTGSVFSALDLDESERRHAPQFANLDANSVRRSLHNDLESAAIRCEPTLKNWRELFDQSEAAHFCMSGSGSSFFGIYDSNDRAQVDLDRLICLAQAAGMDLRGNFLCEVTALGER
jgi:4-diphosphocytidyl-2-C-methyl-D-erythritol kinase